MFQNISISSKEVNFDASDMISINQNFTWNKHNLIIFLTNTITVLSVNVLVLLWLKIKELVCLSSKFDQLTDGQRTGISRL